MESTLHDLGQLLLKAIPTLFLLLVVHLYLKQMFFRPMADVLAKRRAATEGLRDSADAMRAWTIAAATASTSFALLNPAGVSAVRLAASRCK